MSMLIDTLKECKNFLKSNTNNTDKRAKVQTADFAVGFLQAAAKCGRNFSLAELRLSFSDFLGTTLSTSAFNSRLQSKGLSQCLQLLVTFLIAKIALIKSENIDHGKILDALGVSEVIGIDSSMVTLWDGLKDYFGGTFMNASIKLHFSINLLVGSIDRFKITEGKVHDSQWFPRIARGKLYLFDLGYWSIDLLKRLEKKKALYLSRLKSNAKIIVTDNIYGLGAAFIGTDLLAQSIKRKRTKIVELSGMLMVGKKFHETRIIGFWHKGEKQYRWYVTNLACHRKYIYELYRLRWQVELSFKAMKSSLSFDRIPTLSQSAAKNFVYIAILNYLFAVLLKLEAEDTKTRNTQRNASIQKAAKVLQTISEKFYDVLRQSEKSIKTSMDTLQRVIGTFRSYLFDPNHKNRKPTTACLAGMR